MHSYGETVYVMAVTLFIRRYTSSDEKLFVSKKRIGKNKTHNFISFFPNLDVVRLKLFLRDEDKKLNIDKVN